MSSKAKYRMKIGVAIIFCAIATIMVVIKITGIKNSEGDDNLISNQDVVTTQVNYTYWPGLFFELRSLINMQHQTWEKEDAIKKLIRVGEVAIAMEELKELKRRHAEAKDNYDKEVKKAKLADPEAFNIYDLASTTWAYEVNAAHVKYRTARSSEEMLITHREYLNKLYKTKIELPKDY